MTALSTLRWFPDFQARSHDQLACTTPRRLIFDKLKRKRSGSVDPASRDSGKPPAKRQRPDADIQATAASQEQVAKDSAPQDSHVTHVQLHTSNDGKPPTANDATPGRSPEGESQPQKSAVNSKMDPLRLDRAREKMLAQIDLEILLKHNEHRLIEQELAKCQIALEQLRRCSIIPFPAEGASPDAAMQVSTGTGPALHPGAGYSRPLHPAPWGVTDGPYTQHYARWLISDPQFDSHQLNAKPSNGTQSGALEGRPLRHEPRSQRFSTDQRLHSLPGSSGQPREKTHGPLILHRKPDNQWVKMVCRHCGKNDASSTQGFLNHCRIAHQITFPTHEDALNDCGVPLDAQELAAHQAADPQAARTPGTATFNRSMTHPLAHSSASSGRSQAIRSPLSPPSQASSARRPSPPTVDRDAKRRKLSHVSVSPQTPNAMAKRTPGAPFVPSSQVPNLSALMQRRGIGGDLNQLVQSAKERCPMDLIESLEDEEGTDDSPTAVTHLRDAAPTTSTASGMRIPATRGNVAGAAQGGSRCTEVLRTVIPDSQSSSFGHPVHTSCLKAHQSVTPTSPSHDRDAADLSPSTNPGLVTDREDDGEEDVPSDADNGGGAHLPVAVRGDPEGELEMSNIHVEAATMKKGRPY